MKYLALLMLSLLLLMPIVANAQDPAEEPPPPVEEPEEPENTAPTIVENYWSSVESWVLLWVGTFLAAGMTLATSVSTVKTLLLAPLRDNVEFFNLEIYNGITIYQAVVLGLVMVMAGLSYTADLNPFKDTPIEWAQNIPAGIQAIITVAIISYLAVADHEFLDWLQDKTKPTAKG